MTAGTHRSAPSAVFLDRDGTIIVDTGYPSSTDSVALIPGAAAAISRLNAAHVGVIVVTNQSGIGRGLVTTEQLAAVAERMSVLLAADGARIDATYVCPHTEADACECRKPGTLLYRRAARELDIDLTSAWYVGDRLRDVLPALALGGRGVLVPSAATPEAERTDALARLGVAASLGEVVDHILGPLTARAAQG